MTITLQTASAIRVTVRGTPYLTSPAVTLAAEARASASADEAEAFAVTAAAEAVAADAAADAAAASAAGLSAALGASFVTSVAEASLSGEVVLTDTTSVTWDRSTPGQIKATATAADGSISTIKLADDATTNAKLANMAVNTVKGRITSGTGDPEDLTAAQVRTITTSPGVTRQTRLTLSSTEQGWTAIPAGTFRIDIGIVGLSTSGTSNPIIQLGDSGGYETTGYTGATIYTLAATTETGVNFSSGFLVTSVMASTMFWTAQVTLLLDDAASNTWTFAVNGGRTDNTATADGAGSKALSATLDRVRITTAGGADTFDAGTISAVCWHS